MKSTFVVVHLKKLSKSSFWPTFLHSIGLKELKTVAEGLNEFVDLAITDSPYNTRREAARDNLDHGSLPLEHITNTSDVVDRVIVRAVHAVNFYLYDPFTDRHK